MPELPDRRWLVAAAVVLVAGAALVLWPYAPWIVIALWISSLVQPWHDSVSKRLGNRPTLGAVVTVASLTLLLVPVAVLVASLAADAIALVQRVMQSDRAQSLLQTLVSGGSDDTRSPSDLVDVAFSQSGRAWAVAQHVAGTAAHVVIGLVIVISGVFALLVAGGRWYGWAERHVPIDAAAFRRLASAFVETGRGLFFGVLGAGLAQAILATVLYLVLDVPRPFALGLLTLACSIIPAVGTSLVWIPISIGLAVTGRTTAAAIMLGSGVFLIGTIDNLVRPYLARRGQLQLPTYVVLISMFGGIELMGGRGLIFGPLLVRLAKEALALVADQRKSS